MTIPDYQSLMLPLLKQAALGETRVPEVANKIADEFGLTTEERDQLLPSGRKFSYKSELYMAEAGLIDLPPRR
jgi:restriction system protein